MHIFMQQNPQEYAIDMHVRQEICHIYANFLTLEKLRKKRKLTKLTIVLRTRILLFGDSVTLRFRRTVKNFLGIVFM